MKITEKFKKFAAITLAGAMILLTANSMSVHAQTISDVSVSKPGYGVVTTSDGSGVNVRWEANTDSNNIIVSIPNGTNVMIVGEEGDFYKVQYSKDGYYGYMTKEYVKFTSKSYYLKANTSSSPLNMRSGASTSASVLAKIPKGTGFAYVSGSASDGWYRGVYGNVTGYTSADYTLRLEY